MKSKVKIRFWQWIEFLGDKVMLTCAISIVPIGKISNCFWFQFLHCLLIVWAFYHLRGWSCRLGRRCTCRVVHLSWELFFICSSPIESNTAHLSRPIHPLSSNHISGLLQVEKITYSSAVMCLSSECSLFPLPTLPFLGVFIFAF